MKLKLLLLINLFFVGVIYAQCPTGNVTLASQNEVDNFLVNYPTCTTITGNLLINTNSDISDLSPLANINFVTGTFSISGSNYGTSNLTTLNGLNIQEVNSLIINRNQALTEIDALTSLTILNDGGLLIYENPVLANLNGLSNLVPMGNGNSGEIVGNFWVSDNPLISSLSVFEDITKVGFEVQINKMPSLLNLSGLHNITESGSLIISENSGITDLSGLEGFTKVTTQVVIFRNDNITSLTGLDNLSDVEGSFRIEDNNQLQDLTGLGGLTTVITNFNINAPQFFDISNNDNLTSLNGLSTSLTTIGGDFSFYYNNNLTDLSALNNITNIVGDLRISNNALMANLNGFQNLLGIGQTLQINSNASLSNLDGLVGLTSIGETLSLYSNYNLGNINGLSNLSSVEEIFINDNSILTNLIGLEGITSVYRIRVVFNPSLQSLDGLDNVSVISADLEINTNASLTDVTALSSLTSVGTFTNHDFKIVNNANLVSLDGFQNLTVVNGEIIINQNNNLTDITSLENIDPNTFWRLVIQQNPNLTVCSLPNFCSYLSDANNLRSIALNLNDCVSDTAILNACTLGTEDINITDVYKIYPNPVTNGQLFIKAKNSIKNPINISIYNLLGQDVLKQKFSQSSQEISMNINSLKTGIYLVKVEQEKKFFTTKLVVE
ncbi:T9SS type A sorting domain-containing protein [Mesoflavibacter sp. SCSIO 43206]|uniref:T9SS type A sorting domain-containing protein n=1 Tax=Mesoflavibacter sp. SCSIO 43206 TaxID=2779362 RepID=UPI001CA98078|nr:T9SS type A sorting domain-containing protein [Mesoflavibacter sp. SCSIO 43206]UAB76117.1 T9SS type A sorting domain-containing protein [Mesoflavibacter sp. SCSIO 43206]